jgi:hypothetical protein
LKILSNGGGGLNPGSASGNIFIRATGHVTLHVGGIGDSDAYGAQHAGQITVRAATLALTEDARIESNNGGGGRRPGNIVIDVGRLTMKTADPQDLRSRPSISTLAMEARGEGGNISVSARDAILIDGGTISTARVGVPGGGGSITLSTPQLRFNHLGRVATGSDSSRAGDISVNVRTLNMFNGGTIDTGGSVRASTGNIDIVASHSISMAGVGAGGFRGLTKIVSQAADDGSLGRVHIVTPTMHVDDRAVVIASGDSQTGHIDGGIVLDVGRLDVLRGARIESSWFGGGPSVPIIINAAKSITLNNSTITASGREFEQSGNVSLHAGKSILLRNGSLISADNTSSGGEMGETFNAGHIAIHAGRSVVIRDSTVSAQAQQGNGGTIVVDAKQVTLTNSQLTTSVSGGPATVGGDISVDAKTLMLRNSQLLSTATEGQGGSIHLRSHVLRQDARSVIDASSESGTDGTVTIESRR